MIDFKQVRSFSGGQREAFEELVCQLGRREVVATGSYFRRVEGSGGDGGVEAYWLLHNGKKIGYQAKYFTRAGDIDWGQIDKSVKQALKIHPTLVKYIIAIPCDLTDRRGLKGKGQTGWELWESHKKKWRTGRGRSVEFIPWTASVLQDKLSMPSAEGLRRYWFGTTELSPDWFRDHVHLAVTSLDERYHPEDHVEVGLENLFQYIVRSEVARKNLRGLLATVKRAPFPHRQLSGREPKIPSLLIDEADASLAALLAIEAEFEFPIWQEWDVARWKKLLSEIVRAIGKLISWAQNARLELSEKKNQNARSSVEYVLSDLIKVNDAISALDDLVVGRYLSAENDRVALIEGRAGTGKSHLLGQIAEKAIRDANPVILLLGQQFRDQSIWNQIAKQLGLGETSADELLQSLDVVAEATRKRALILVDAVNEGAGARLWKPEIAEFLERIKRFPNLTCIISCRSEYVPYVFPGGVLSEIQRFEIRGFATVQEQIRAARVYLDKRGISRPSTPWLAPEFVNPLFLRSTCVALTRDKKSEFPRGLTGAKSIFSFYVKSVGRNLGAGRDGSDQLVPATINSLRAMAAQMAANREDYITLAHATSIANDKFSSFPAPIDQTWLDVLHRNGLLRSDPDPNAIIGDALAVVEDVIRFSFQRFQDHLMAETLLENVTDIGIALADGGRISFIRNGKKFQWRWQGLVEALSLQIPERFSVELADVLPGKAGHWWNVWQVRDAFAESVRWRDKQAFSDRTLELFNRLPAGQIDPFSLLIELSASVDHPWNANFLHRNLVKRQLPKRDAFWTASLNGQPIEGEDPVGRLVDWCLFGQSINVDRATQRLCGITLCWLFTSSHRGIRDGATKALTSLFISRHDIFPEIAELFNDVDDIYVTERLYAAAYGACCIDPSRARLESYAVVTFNIIFSRAQVPLSLLLRDYARGIVERCAVDASLPSTIEVKKCRPPYRSTKPRLNTSIAELEKIAKKAGDQAILNSCTGWVGDFGKYELAPRTSSFTAVPLNQSQPFSSQEIFARFEAEVIDKVPARVEAVERLRKVNLNNLNISWLGNEKKPSKAKVTKLASDLLIAETALLELLTPAEKRRYRTEAASHLGTGKERKSSELPSFNVASVGRWVAKRAYNFGWTKKLFPNDAHLYGGSSGKRPELERIGKKYQWIALDELLCRLADNYWIGGRYGDSSRIYDSPLDVGFERDIDPTVIPITQDADNSQGHRAKWILGPDIILDDLTELRLPKWPFQEEPSKKIADHIYKVDENGVSWITLYEYRSKTNRYENYQVSYHGQRQQEFRFLMCVFIPTTDCEKLIDFLRMKKSLDVMDWDPTELADGPFLGEAPWRNTWPQEQFRNDMWRVPKGTSICFPVCEYIWESHLDAALPKGAKAYIPSPWLAKEMKIFPNRKDASLYGSADKPHVFIGSKLGEEGSTALIEKQALETVLLKKSLQCLWFFVGERTVWPDGDNHDAAWRRSEGICWVKNGKPVLSTWNKDAANGRSKAALPKMTKRETKIKTKRKRHQ